MAKSAPVPVQAMLMGRIIALAYDSWVMARPGTGADGAEAFAERVLPEAELHLRGNR